MNFFAISGLLNAITSIGLGFLVFSRNKKNKVNVTFALFCVSIAIWSGSYYLWQISRDAVHALFWARMLMAGAIFIPIFYYHFALSFTKLIRTHVPSLRIGYGLTFLFLFFSFTPWFVSHVEPILGFPFWPKPGPIFHPFLVFWLSYAVACTLILTRYYRHSTGVVKNQARLLLWGITIGYLGGITNYFLWYNILIVPFGNILVTIYVVFTAYAILKYKLMDIKVIATQVFSLTITSLTFLQIFYAESTTDFLLNFGLFLATLIFTVLLIRSVLKEVRRREELEKITHQLASATKRLQKANRELKKLDEAKSEFISIASHQLRTPLTAIKGYGSMLLAGDFGKLANLKQKDAVNKMFLSNDRLITLVENLLNVSRIESGRINFTPHPMQLEGVVSDIITTLTNNAREAGLYLKLDKPAAPLPLVNVDEEKIRQTIINFIDNAIKYTRQGGITVELRLKGKNVQCCVRDTGIGISPDDQKKLFKKFSRGKDAFMINSTGNGLGLYVAHMMVAGHNGKVWVESEGEGKGSSFCFSVPVAEAQKPAAVPAKPKQTPATVAAPKAA